jgi:HAE1 family hydrophobic/amphiphilic exporter-1
LIPKLSLISGLYKIETSGDEKKEHHIIYDKDKMISLGIDVLKIESALQPYLKKESIGKIQLGTHQYLATSVISKSNFDFNSIIVGKTNDRLITLGEIAQVVNESDPVQNILRINGTENVRLTFFPEKNANHITVANAIQKIINETNWPRGVQPLKQVDTTEFINNELIKIKTRFLATFILLFIFIYIAYRDFKTLLISLSALIINFGIALLAYKVL